MSVLFDDASPNDVLLEDAPCAVCVDMRIPDVIGINHDHGPVSALVHASCVIDAHDSLESGGGCAFLEDRMNFQ